MLYFLILCFPRVCKNINAVVSRKKYKFDDASSFISINTKLVTQFKSITPFVLVFTEKY